MELTQQNITVVGMGRSGIAAANFLAERGARVTLIDAKSRAELAGAADRVHPQVRLQFETSAPESTAEMIVLSPGVAFHAPFLASARARGTEIISEVELASRFARWPIIAVTGTNGKSTCTTLIGEILKQAGKAVHVGGNIGTPFISLLEAERADYLVLEVSSFQLEGIQTFHPWMALVLNLTPDHMDRHKTMEHYAELKSRIAQNQTARDFLILNRDDPWTVGLGGSRNAHRVYFSRQTEVEEGAFLKDGVLFTRFEGRTERICAAKDLKPPMQWQVENVLAASAAAALAGVGPETLARTVTHFAGLPHRLEWVRTVRGIDFINDSKGTNIGSVRKSLSTFDRPVILIVGGKDKDTDFQPLKPLIQEKVKHLILIGETRPKFRDLLNASISYEEAESLEEAVGRAAARARTGDVVLLSPGCASFDMFRDYADRGDRFKTLVNRL